MILLTGTSDILRVVVGAAASVTVHASYVDNAAGTITPGRLDTPAIVAASTVTVVASPAAATQRNVRGLYITNNHASASATVTVQHFDGTNSTDLMGVLLLPGENLVLDETGQWKHHDAQGGEYAGRPAVDVIAAGYGLSATIAETIPRHLCTETNVAALTSGTLYLTAVYLKAGQRINNISFFSATTASGTPTNGFFGLYDINRNKVAETANFTTEAWAANSIKTKPLTATYVVPSDGLYYVGIMITATTVPTLKGNPALTGGQLHAATPTLHGNSSTALTTALPASAAAITGGTTQVWAALS